MDITSRNMIQHKYGRDYLLQLRLHPFSLQKPNNLKNHDIVKEKLYLHQLNISSGSHNTRLSCYPDLQLPLKDPENVLRYHHPIPDCFSRNYSSNVAGRKSNTGMHVKPSSKYRQLYIPDYVNPMQKLQFRNATDYEDLLNDGIDSSSVPWLKQWCSFSEETWNSQNLLSDHESFSKSSFEGSVKSKKKPLPIIDPKNGKNILDGICVVSTTSQEKIISEGKDDNFETKSGNIIITELNKQSDHDECCLSKTNYNDETGNITTQNLSDIDSSCLSQISDFGIQNISCKDKEPKIIYEDHGNNISATFKDENHVLKYDFDMNLKLATGKAVDNGIAIKEILDSDYEFYKKFPANSYDRPRISDSFESLEVNTSKDVHDDCLNQKKSTTDRYKTMAVQESGFSFEEQLKMNIKLLKEKIYSIRQEQQKMAIMQSFLCFKKHQLDESFRRMDDKKIEIANQACDLANQAKRLQEKECRLEARRLNFLDKESKLDEREKMLNEIQKYTETKFQQGDITSGKIGENSESKANDSEKTFSANYELGDTSEVKF